MKAKVKLFDAQAIVNSLYACFEDRDKNPDRFSKDYEKHIPDMLTECYKLLEDFQIKNKIT